MKAAKAQDNAVEERTNKETKDFKQYCNMPGMCVPAMKVFEHEGGIEEERGERKNGRKELPQRKRSESSWQKKNHIKQI